jgi:hypothetical protein
MERSPGPSAEDGGRSRGMPRRTFNKALLLAAGPVVAGTAGGFLARSAAASPTYLSTFDQRRFFAYPHQNAFLDGGRTVVLGQMDGRGMSSLWLYDIPGNTSNMLARFIPPIPRDYSYCDIAETQWLLAASDTQSLWTIDLLQDPTPRRLYTPPLGNSLDPLVSIRYDDASTILAAYRPIGARFPTTVVRVRVSDGLAMPLFTKNFHVNHLQHSPNDPAWFGFSREAGNVDRIWGYHPTAAPEGKLLWDQKSPTGGDLRVGHEVWCRHDLSILVVAYRDSPGSPRGLYQVWPDGSSRLVQEADNYLHCNVSRDGRHAVVDTTAGGIVLIDMAGQVPPRQLAATRIGPHPRHPHPNFTPDGTQIIYTDTNASNQVRVAMVPIT